MKYEKIGFCWRFPFLWVAIFLTWASSYADGEVGWFYRVVAESESQILSIEPEDNDGFDPSSAKLVWTEKSNTPSGRIDIKYGLSGQWHTNCVTLVQRSGNGQTEAYAFLGYVPGRVLIGFQDAVSIETAVEFVMSHSLVPDATSFKSLHLIAITVPIESELYWVDLVERSSLVKYAQLSYISYSADQEIVFNW